MNQKNSLIKEYIQEVDNWLPYTKKQKMEILDNLEEEVVEAIQDKKNPDPVVVYGDPFEIAKGLSMSQDWDLQPANWYIRIVAFLIDAIVITSICFSYLLFGFLIIFRIDFTRFLSIGSLEDAIEVLRSNLESGVLLIGLIILILYIIGALIISAGYFIVLEKYYSTSPGKKLLGLLVVDISGVKMTWKQSFLRNLTKIPGIVEFLPFDMLLGILLVEKG